MWMNSSARSTFDCSRFDTARAITNADSRDLVEHHSIKCTAVGAGIIDPYEAKGVHCLHGAFEAHLSRLQFVLESGLGNDFAKEVVCEEVNPDFLADHRRRFASQDGHLHRVFYRT